MLLVGGQTALDGLKNMTIVVSVPFVIVMVGLCVALARDLAKDPLVVRTTYAREAAQAAVVAGVTEYGDDFAFEVTGVDNNGSRSDADDDAGEASSGGDGEMKA